LDAYILRTSSLTTPRTLGVEMACDPGTRAWLKEQPIQLVTFDAL